MTFPVGALFPLTYLAFVVAERLFPGRAGGSSTARARINIQRRIANALRKIADASPALGRHLGRSIRTGA